MKRRLRCFLIALVPVLSLRLAAQDGPPKEDRTFREADIVELVKLDPAIRLDVRYATTNNFAGRAFYPEARAFLQRPAAEALVRVNRALKEKGWGVMVFDGYRPWSVTKAFWDATPADKRIFVADPRKGSRHNRGCAVDLTLYDLKTGRAADMGSEYDEMSARSYFAWEKAPEAVKSRRDLLRAAMENEGFFVYPFEWWHFDFKDWREYPILDLPFAALALSPAGVSEVVHGTIPKGSIVLLRTGWSARWPDRKAYFGDDTPNAGAAQVVGLENLTNLSDVPATGAWLVALPMKIGGGSGGPLRVVALVPR